MPRDPRQGGPNDLERFLHIRDAGRDVLTFVKDRQRTDLSTDAMLTRALVNALQVIGEAAARVTDDGRAHSPTLPWGQIVAARNILVHVYWGIDHDQLWLMATQDVPSMMVEIELAITQWPSTDS